MTLALYGKSRKRKAGLVGTALLAVVFATVAALWVVTLAFAHHLNYTITTPTCENQDWKVEVTTGTWDNWREAVVTITDGSTPDFEPAADWNSGAGPFVYKGANRTIISMSGTGTVHSSGKVEQYKGSFGDNWGAFGIDDNDTSFSALAAFPSGYDNSGNTVVLWGSELMRVTGRSADGKTLTVERGYGGTTATSHSGTFTGISRWVRTVLDGAVVTNPNSNPNTIVWDLDFDSSSCDPQYTLTATKLDANNVDPQDWDITVTINGQPTTDAASVTVPLATGDSGSIDESWGGAGDATHEFEKMECYDEGQQEPFLTRTDPLPFSFGPLGEVSHNITCYITNKPTGHTITAEKVVCESEADLPNWAGGSQSLDHTRVQNFVDREQWPLPLRSELGLRDPRPGQRRRPFRMTTPVTTRTSRTSSAPSS